MHSSLISIVLAVLAAHVARLSSPLIQTSVPSPATTAAPTCTHTILKQPSFAQTCTNYARTVTITSYTDCGVGCTLTTRRLGVGVPCRTVEYNRGVTATFVTSCKPPPKTTTKTVTRYTRPTGE
ncbi:hypothetical protein SVAN01_04034 [Stagonosporopsis vannaccii]|nr:hypothetical protein SVAN01_04034 [Stagonosporopsis vannaccii]